MENFEKKIPKCTILFCFLKRVQNCSVSPITHKSLNQFVKVLSRINPILFRGINIHFSIIIRNFLRVKIRLFINTANLEDAQSIEFQLPISVIRSHMTKLYNRTSETFIPLYLSMCCSFEWYWTMMDI